MPQIAHLLSPKGAMNQQKEKPDVENSPISSYAGSLKNKFKPKSVEPKGSSVFSRVLGAMGLGENKANQKLNEIYSLLQKIEEKKEKDYQYKRLNEEIEKGEEENRHKEIVNLFVSATKQVKRKTFFRKAMGGGLPSSLLLLGGTIGLLTFGKDAMASAKDSMQTDLVESIQKQFTEVFNKTKKEVDDIDYKREYENIRQYFAKDFESISQGDLELGTVKDSDVRMETTPFPPEGEKPPEPPKAEQIQPPVDKRQAEVTAYPLREATESTAVPITRSSAPMSASPTARRAASLTAQGEVGKAEKNPVTQIVENDPSPGYKSYGIFGMNSKRSRPNNPSSIEDFITRYPEFGLKGLKPGSKEFDERWKALGQTNNINLLNAQIQWYENTIFNPLRNSLLKELPERLANDERVLIYMADRRAQYGYVAEEDALRYARSASTPEEFIRKMSEFDRNPENIKRAFETKIGTTSPEQVPGLIQGLINRVNLREQKALNPENIGTIGSTLSQGSSELKLSRLFDGMSVSDSGMQGVINNVNVMASKTIVRRINTSIHDHPMVA